MKKRNSRFLCLFLACMMLGGCGNAAGPGNEKSNEAVTGPAETEPTATPKPTATQKPTATPVPTATNAPVEEVNMKDYGDKYMNIGMQLLDETIRKYYNKKTGSLKTSLINDAETTLWPFASFLEALSESLMRDPENQELREVYKSALDTGLQGYRVENATIKAPAGTFPGQLYFNAGWRTAGDYYYDDNAWICFQLFTAYDILGEQKYLDDALKLLEFFWTGYDTEVLGGGIYWDKTYGKGKGICTNAPITICYLIGYQKTGEQDYLDKALTLYNWMINSALMTQDWTIHAGFTEDGKVDNWIAAYDQGTLIYATSLLYEITGDSTYLVNAGKIAMGASKLIFKKQGDTYVMKGNPIFKTWCIGWAVRGMEKYYETCNVKTHTFMEHMYEVLDVNMTTKNAAGQYDPFFSTGDWWDQPGYDTAVIQPSGMCVIYTLAGDLHKRDAE
ncbi:MAG: hypothetical protein J6Z46_09525 [Lachnospiraceae bacterium]|nr:hypothetical protein [Lachnospiraceae bacterium]